MSAQLLDGRAWMRGESPDEWPRSRYCGVALHGGEMAVTIIVSWAERFGHSFVAFEWFADEVPGPRTSQRRHEVYHLRALPTDEERAMGITNPAGVKLLSWRTRHASIDIECDPGFFPLHDAGGQELPAYFRAWLVPFPNGWRARNAAVAASASPPRYNYLELGGGKNCARWALEVTAHAGIDARHWLSSVIAVPKRLVRRYEPIRDEGRMWRERMAGSGSPEPELHAQAWR
jgi:hypothetical protein